ncbi:Zinc finger and SCAN domain-containing protein 20 [Chelonia mydas]|uniref:Zinc finger and SCAN domain-containing protein 20 n=1 Tax=Chelonia mydas TaxID=8469 RepID=M7B6L2_CHEMY|nr:Zinc finger and SCAN domain-containing protein 20 [Chelonia mydas]
MSSQLNMAAPHSKRSPAWTTAELLDLLSIWGEESLQSQLRSSHRDFDTYRQISQSLCKKGYDQDTLQCAAKIKELRQVYQKARETTHHSSAMLKTCHFYKELNAILDYDPTSTAKNPVDTLAGLEPAQSEPNPEDKVIDEEVELDDDMELTAGSPSDASNQELFSTSQSQQSQSGEQEAREGTPSKWFCFVKCRGLTVGGACTKGAATLKRCCGLASRDPAGPLISGRGHKRSSALKSAVQALSGGRFLLVRCTSPYCLAFTSAGNPLP